MVTILKVIAVNEGGTYLVLSYPRRWGISNRGESTGVL